MQSANSRKIQTAPAAAPPAIAWTWVLDRECDDEAVFEEVADEVRFPGRAVLLDEDEDVVEELVAEEEVCVVLLVV